MSTQGKFKQPLLCKLGFHDRYHYLPKVGRDLREISIACKRCGWGLRYRKNTWDIEPEIVKKEIREQAEILFGEVLGWLRGMNDPYLQMKIAYNSIKNKFTEEELRNVTKQMDEMDKINKLGDSLAEADGK